MNIRTYQSMLPVVNYDSKRVFRVISEAYKGAGMMSVNHKLREYPDKTFIGYDINSAYQSVLLDNNYPYGNIWTKDNINIPYQELLNIVEDRFYVAYVEVRNLKLKFENFDVISYSSMLDYCEGVWFGWLNNVDIDNMTKLYDGTIIIKSLAVFEHNAPLSDYLKSYINCCYDTIHNMKKGKERKNLKLEFNIMTYGKNAQKRYTQSGEENGLRSRYVHIAMYQAAYTRKRIIDLLVKYNDSIIYTDTDSIYLDSKVKFEEPISDKIGEFKVEQPECKLYIFRYKGYIIFNLDDSIRIQKVAGINTMLTLDEINRIKKGEVIESKVVLENGETQLVKVYDKFTYGVKIFI